MIPQEQIKKAPQAGRCQGNGERGRCQLRGSAGTASADGGHWYCAWHAEVVMGRTKPSYEKFTEFIGEQKEYGSTRWNHRTIAEWWDLIQGVSGPGGYEWQKIGDAFPEHAQRKMPGY